MQYLHGSSSPRRFGSDFDAPLAPKAQVVTAFFLSFLLIGAAVLIKGPRLPDSDEFVYLAIAHDLNRSGIFTDGTFSLDRTQATPGRFFSPAYPILLHLLSLFESRLAQKIACYSTLAKDQLATCGGSVALLLAVQTVLAAAQATSIYVIAWLLSRSWMISLVALLLGLATGEFDYYARHILTENLAFTGFFGFLATFALAIHRPTAGRMALSGIMLGIATLARPSYLYLIYALIPALIALAILKRDMNVRLAYVGALAAGAVIVIAPWLVRNWLIFSDPALTSGYGGFILAQRLAYNAMTWTEWGVSLIYWLPDFGDGLAKKVFDRQHWIRLGWTDPTCFYLVGNGSYMTDTVKAAGGRQNHLSYLMNHELLGNLFKHVMVTISIALRGLWVGKYLSLIGLIALVPLGIVLARQGRLALLLAVGLPLAFTVGLHGFVSVNVPRYNVPVLALFCLTTAYAAVALAWIAHERWTSRRASTP